MAEQQAVLDHFVERLRQSDGVELAATYGSFGTAAFTETSDVDIFFVPASPADRTAALQVIVADIGHDLWPLEWSRLEQIADLSDPLTALLLDSTVVLGAAAARERLEGLRSRCRAHLEDPARRVVATRRLLDRVAAALGRSSGEDDDPAALADPVTTLLTGWAFLCGAYLATGPGHVLDRGAPWLPDKLRALLTDALTARDADDRWTALRQALAAADGQLTAEATALEAPLPRAARPAAVEGGYEELHSVLAKVLRTGATAALAAATATQEGGTMLRLLDTGRWPVTPRQARQVWREHGLRDLSACLGDPDALAAAIAETTERLPTLLRERGVRIRCVESAADLTPR